MPNISSIAESVLSKPPKRSLSEIAEGVLAKPAPKPDTPPASSTIDVSLNLDDKGVPLPTLSAAQLARRHTAPVEKAKPVTPQGPGLKDVEIGARQGAVTAVRTYANPASAIYGGRLASGRTLSEAAEEHLGPDPEDVEARQSVGSKVIQGVSRAPLDIARYAMAPGKGAGMALSMAGVDALEASDGTPGEMASAAGHGLIMGAALGPLGRYGRAARVPAAGAVGAGMTAASGGDVSDIVASGVVMGGLSGMHGAQRKPPPELTTPRPQAPREQAKAQEVVPFPADKSGERGSFSLKPTGPQTPSEVYAKEQVAKREAARKGPMRAMVDRLKVAVAKAKTEAVDSTAPILDTIHRAQKEHKFELRPGENIEHQIDRVYRSRSIADQFMKDNRLIEAIQKVDDIDYFDQYLIAKQAIDVEAHGFKTGRDLVRDGQLVRDFQKRYADAEKVIREYDQKLLDYSVEAGLIPKELADHLQQIYKDYVPLNRVFNALEKGEFDKVGKRGVASLSKQSVVEKLMGSERQIENPLASFIDKTYRAVSQGERNKAGRMLAGYRDLPGMLGLIKEIKAGSNVPADRTFSFLDNGTKRTFETTREIAAAAKSLDVRDIGLLGQIFAVPARIMKTGTTGINLPFVASNVAVDQTFTLITSRYDRSLANPITFLRALTATLKHDKLWDEMVREGGGFTSFDLSRNQPKKTIDRIRAGRGTEAKMRYAVEHPVSTVAELFRAAEDAVSRSEQFGRLRLYAMAKEAALKAKRTEADARIIAAQHANNALPNYLRSGTIMRPINAAVPYLNAGTQGVRAFLRAMEENPVRTSAAVATTLFFPVAMATMWNLSDPDRKRAYADIQEFDKENNLVILMPGKPTQDKQGRYKVIKIKLPPGLNRLASPVRRFLEQADGMDPVRARELFDAVLGSVSPVEPNISGLSNVVPQALKPTLQAFSNYDFFRHRPKVPARLQGLPRSMQVQPYTSGTARKIGEAIDASPIKVEEFVKDTLGGIGGQVLHYSDRALAAAGAIPPDQIGGVSTPEAVMARFGTARGGELESQAYAKRKEVEDATITKAVERARQTPFYSRLATEELRQRHLETVASRARYEVSKVTSTPRYMRLQPEQKMAELERVGARIARSGVPPRVTRPSPPPLRSPRPFEARQ